MIRTIIGVKDPRLRNVSKPVVKIDKKTLSIVSDLRDTLSIQKDPQGVGLAAPQIGKNLRIFVIEHEGVKRVVINPKIVKISRKRSLPKKNKKTSHTIMEGCLSLPNYYAPLERRSRVMLTYLNQRGERLEEEFKDFLAQVVLHEMDHLEGILFIDRLLEQKQPLYKLHGDHWDKVDLGLEGSI